MNKNDLAWRNKWPAPAKLNLTLRIVGRRDDGYHLLQTVFQLIDLCDWLTFAPTEDGRVRLLRLIPGVPEQQDLAVRAALLLKQETGYRGGVSIDVDKNLPMGGGLGGGSSDAATVLVVLNHLWELGLTLEQLMKLGLSLGADVPIFVYGYSAWAEGVGEKLETISLPKKWFLIVKPDCHVETKAVFCAKDLTRNSKPITIRDFLLGQRQNDCLAVVRERYQVVADALNELSRFGEARLTGTGACVFVEFDAKVKAQEAYEALQKDGRVYMAAGMDRSPLYKMLECT